MSRAEVGKDGKAAYERIRGNVAKIEGLECGEGLLWKRRREGGPLGKLTCMWEDGIYLGMEGGTGEIILGNRKTFGGRGRSGGCCGKKGGAETI